MSTSAPGVVAPRQKFHFISGLPRSGSTLLSALLRQNPRIHASLSSALAPLVAANLSGMSVGGEIARMLEEGQRPAILKAIIKAFSETTSDREVFIDTNRAWCARMPLIADLFPEAKVIACVRDVSWVIDSLERVFQKDPYENTLLFGNDSERATVFSRADTLARPNRLVGYAWTSLKEAFYGEFSDRLLIVDYEILTRSPEKTLKLVYRFLGEEWFDGHDFENVSFDAPRYDEALGVKGLHKVRPKVEFTPRRTILPPDVFQKFEGMDFWRGMTGSGASIIAPKAARQSAKAENAETTKNK